MSWFKQRPIRQTLTAIMCGLSLVPLIAATIAGAHALHSAMDATIEHGAEALEKQSLEKLEAIRDIKAHSLTNYFSNMSKLLASFSHMSETKEAMEKFPGYFQSYAQEASNLPEFRERSSKVNSFYTSQFGANYKEINGSTVDTNRLLQKLDATAQTMQYAFIAANSAQLGSKDEMQNSGFGTQYDQLHQRIHPTYRTMLQKFELYDIFLIEPKTGNIVYSVYKELDYATSLTNGPYADSNLAAVFQKAMQLKPGDAPAIEDFARYLPSYHAPAIFMAAPIFSNSGKKLGILAFQLPVEPISALMTNPIGLGKTGETYLLGPDKLLRSDTRNNPDSYNVSSSLQNPGSSRIKTEELLKALGGESNESLTKNYEGKEVIGAYAPLDIPGLEWAIAAEVTVDEAMESLAILKKDGQEISDLQTMESIVIMVISMIFIGVVARVVSNTFSVPLVQAVSVLDQVAHGNLRVRMDEGRGDEIGHMATALNAALQRMQTTIKSLSKNAAELRTSADTLSSTGNSIADGTKEAARQFESVAAGTKNVEMGIGTVTSGTEQMTAAIQEIAHSAAEAATVANNAVQRAESTNAIVTNLGESSEEIGNVIKLILSIADQTNLLALNATIEASRAGEAGRGFAIVANEIKELARKTADATTSISERVTSIQGGAQEAIQAIQEVSAVIGEIDAHQGTIAAAVEEQTNTTQEMASSVGLVATNTQDISQEIGTVSGIMASTSEGAIFLQTAATELKDMANMLEEEVRHFQI